MPEEQEGTNASAQLMQTHEFDGQQEDERVLYVIRMHPVKRIIHIAQGLLCCVLLLAIVTLVLDIVAADKTYLTVLLSLITLLFFVAWVWYGEHYMHVFKTVITDRRIVRIEFAFPFFKKKRALFWNEVAKVKTTAPSILFSLSKIGSLTIQPLLVPNEEIHIPYVYYFADLANYIDKILYVRKNKPEDADSLRPFVPKPKGMRY